MRSWRHTESNANHSFKVKYRNTTYHLFAEGQWDRAIDSTKIVARRRPSRFYCLDKKMRVRLWPYTASNLNDPAKSNAEIQTTVPTVRPEPFRSHRCKQDKRTSVIAIIVYLGREWVWDYDLTLDWTPTTRPKSSTGTQTYGHFHFSRFFFPEFGTSNIMSGRMSSFWQLYYRNQGTTEFVPKCLIRIKRPDQRHRERALYVHHFAPLALKDESTRNPRQRNPPGLGKPYIFF